MDAEETLAALSQEARFDLTITVEPQPMKPSPRAPATRKPRKGKKKRRHSAIENTTARPRGLGLRLNQAVAYDDPNASLSSRHMPKFQVTAKATIFGRELQQVYGDVMPGAVDSVREELTERFRWYVEQLYASKKVRLGVETKQVKVDLSK